MECTPEQLKRDARIADQHSREPRIITARNDFFCEKERGQEAWQFGRNSRNGWGEIWQDLVRVGFSLPTEYAWSRDTEPMEILERIGEYARVVWGIKKGLKSNDLLDLALTDVVERFRKDIANNKNPKPTIPNLVPIAVSVDPTTETKSKSKCGPKDELATGPQDEIAERIAKLEAIQSQQSVKGKVGRKSIKSETDYLKHLTKYELETIELIKTKTASEIDELMKRRGVKIVQNDDKTIWPYGNAKRVIDKYKKWKNRRGESATK